MRTVHRTFIVSRCPLGCMDCYETEFHTDRLVMVESIQSHIDGLTKEATTQEELTQALADRTECRVVTKGTHSRFLTECEAEPKR